MHQGSRGGHIVGRVRVPILVGNDLPRHDLPYSKGFMKFGCQEPSKIMFNFWNFCSSKRRLTQFVRVPPYEILVFLTNFIFFRQKEITLWGQKRTALFQTYNWEKSIFFKALERVFAEIYARSLGLDIADCGNSLDGILVLSYVSGWIQIGRIAEDSKRINKSSI